MTTISNGNYGNELVFAEPKIRLDGDLMYMSGRIDVRIHMYVSIYACSAVNNYIVIAKSNQPF